MIKSSLRMDWTRSLSSVDGIEDDVFSVEFSIFTSLDWVWNDQKSMIKRKERRDRDERNKQRSSQIEQWPIRSEGATGGVYRILSIEVVVRSDCLAMTVASDIQQESRSFAGASVSWPVMSIVEVQQQEANGNSTSNACVLPQLRGLSLVFLMSACIRDVLLVQDNRKDLLVEQKTIFFHKNWCLPYVKRRFRPSIWVHPARPTTTDFYDLYYQYDRSHFSPSIPDPFDSSLEFVTSAW